MTFRNWVIEILLSYFLIFIHGWHFKTKPLSYRPDQEWVAVNFVILWQYQFFKIVHNVTWTIAVATSSTHDCQQSWLLIPLLKSTCFVSNYLWFITLKSIHLEVNIVNLWQIEAGWWILGIVAFCHFAWPTFWKWHQGSHIFTNCHSWYVYLLERHTF